MENKHKAPEYYVLNKNTYNMDLFKELNEEYRQNPYMKSFTDYSDEYQIKQAESRLNNLSKIYDLKNKKVLEVGCGGGYVSYCLARDYGCQVTGIDIYSSEHWGKLANKNLKFECVDLSLSNPFGEEYFDIIVSYVAWEHMRHPFKVLQECAKVLKYGEAGEGHMFICANLYRSPIASHLYRNIFFPWPHLLFDDAIVTEYALTQGVEQWWIDAFYYVNKLTYSEYKEYFSRLGFQIINEKFNYAKFDWDFYKRFEDKLGLYPISDLEINFFNVLLRKKEKVIPIERLIIDKIIIEPQQQILKCGDKVLVECSVLKKDDIAYAYYLYYEGEVVFKKMYQNKNSYEFELDKAGKYYVKVFIKDKHGNKKSEVSREIEVV